MVEHVVQHHPRRAGLIGPLLASLPGARVVADPDPDGPRSAWRTQRECLLLPPEHGATHRLVIQDDALVCRDFQAALDRAVDARPENPIVLFVGGHPRGALVAMERACRHDEEFATWPRELWISAVAIVWPVEVMPGIVEWVDRQRYPIRFGADDEIFGRATTALGVEVLATVPSLVQHPDVVESIGRPHRAKAGKDLDRVAWCFIDDLTPE